MKKYCLVLALMPLMALADESTRTFTAAREYWVDGAPSWNFTSERFGPFLPQQMPMKNAAVTISAEGGEGVEGIEIDVNLESDAEYTDFKVTGSTPVRFKHYDAGAIKVTGSVTLGVPTEIDHDALDIADVPLTLADGATVTFNYSNFSLTDRFLPFTVKLTGRVEKNDAKFALIAPESDIWNAELVYEDGGYAMSVTPKRSATTLYLTADATLVNGTLYATTPDGAANMPRFFKDDVIYVMKDVTATFPNDGTAVEFGQFDGSGTILVEEKTLRGNAPLFSLASTWSGVVELHNVNMEEDNITFTEFDLNQYGNVNSKVKLARVTGGMKGMPYDEQVLPEVVLVNEGLEITGGIGFSELNFRKISGTGALRNHPGDYRIWMHVGDISGHTGPVSVRGLGSISFGEQKMAADKGQISVSASAVVAFGNQRWEADGGVMFENLLSVVGEVGDYIAMAEPKTMPGARSSAVATDLALRYENGCLKLVEASASANSTFNYDSVEEAISREQSAAGFPAAITVIKDANVAVEKLTVGDFFTIRGRGGYEKFRWTDAKGDSPKFIVCTGTDDFDNDVLTVKSGTPANGRDSFESYMLNLNAEEATDKPYIKAVSSQVVEEHGEKKIKSTFNFFHGTAGERISARQKFGTMVKYEVLTSFSPSADADWAVEAESANGVVTVELPNPDEGESKTSYFKPRISFE